VGLLKAASPIDRHQLHWCTLPAIAEVLVTALLGAGSSVGLAPNPNTLRPREAFAQSILSRWVVIALSNLLSEPTLAVVSPFHLFTMQVSTYVKEAIDEAILYSNLDHRPDIADDFFAIPLPPLTPSTSSSTTSTAASSRGGSPSSHVQVSSPVLAPDSPLAMFEGSLDTSFFNVFNQSCGYYQLKRFAATCDEAIKLSFIEDATEYRLIDDGARRMQR
jgi:hypothetical protein